MNYSKRYIFTICTLVEIFFTIYFIRIYIRSVHGNETKRYRNLVSFNLIKRTYKLRTFATENNITTLALILINSCFLGDRVKSR